MRSTSGRVYSRLLLQKKKVSKLNRPSSIRFKQGQFNRIRSGSERSKISKYSNLPVRGSRRNLYLRKLQRKVKVQMLRKLKS